MYGDAYFGHPGEGPQDPVSVLAAQADLGRHVANLLTEVTRMQSASVRTMEDALRKCSLLQEHSQASASLPFGGTHGHVHVASDPLAAETAAVTTAAAVVATSAATAPVTASDGVSKRGFHHKSSAVTPSPLPRAVTSDTEPLPCSESSTQSSRSSASEARSKRLIEAWLRLSTGLLASKQGVNNMGRLKVRCLHDVWSNDKPMTTQLESISKYFCLGALEDAAFNSSTVMGKGGVGAGRQPQYGMFLAFLQSRVISPTSMKRMCWDLLALVVLGYDIITFPLRVFDFEETDMAMVGLSTGCVYWSCDFVLSFFRGYLINGTDESRITKIWWRYFRTWFFLDILLLFTDWISLITSTSSSMSAARIAKLGRLSRALRLLRFARLMHMPSIFTAVGLILPQFVMTTLNLLSFLTLPILVAHFMGCLWYWVGAHAQQGESWLDHITDTDKESKVALYVLSFHWSICQYTPAPNSIQPVTLVERLFAIATLLLGFVIFTSFLGSATSLVTATRMVSAKRLHEEWNLRRFIVDNKVSYHLCQQIALVSKHEKHVHASLVEKDIAVFQTLPETMLVRLRFEVYGQVLLKLPLFKGIDDVDRGVVTQLAHKGAQAHCYGRLAELFHFGHQSNNLIVVTHGSMVYTHGYSTARRSSFKEPGKIVQAGAALCEAAFWMLWFHQGAAVSKDWCTVLTMHTDDFMKYTTGEPLVLSCCRSYAREFLVKCIERSGTDSLLDILSSSMRGVNVPHLDDFGLPEDELTALSTRAFRSSTAPVGDLVSIANASDSSNESNFHTLSV